jgi:hypothetical protein
MKCKLEPDVMYPVKTLLMIKRIRDAIVKGVNGRCTVIDGLKLMKDSKYFDGKSKLKKSPQLKGMVDALEPLEMIISTIVVKQPGILPKESVRS